VYQAAGGAPIEEKSSASGHHWANKHASNPEHALAEAAHGNKAFPQSEMLGVKQQRSWQVRGNALPRWAWDRVLPAARGGMNLCFLFLLPVWPPPPLRSRSPQGWLRDEQRVVAGDLVWGILTSVNTAASRLPLLRLWWLPGASGCLSVDAPLSGSALAPLLPPGLEVCATPSSLASRPWMEMGVRGRGLHRGAIMHLVLFAKFPARKW
jgi:hypothetical protein